MKEEKTKTEEPTKTTDIKEFWIGFRDAAYFVRHFLKKGFQHTYIMYKDGDHWVELNPRNHALECYVFPQNKTIDLPGGIAKELGHLFIRIKVKQKMRKWPSLNIFKTIHCTSIVKYILGIRLMAFTPYHLYKRLADMPTDMMGAKGILEIEILGGEENGERWKITDSNRS